MTEGRRFSRRKLLQAGAAGAATAATAGGLLANPATAAQAATPALKFLTKWLAAIAIGPRNGTR